MHNNKMFAMILLFTKLAVSINPKDPSTTDKVGEFFCCHEMVNIENEMIKTLESLKKKDDSKITNLLNLEKGCNKKPHENPLEQTKDYFDPYESYMLSQRIDELAFDYLNDILRISKMEITKTNFKLQYQHDLIEYYELNHYIHTLLLCNDSYDMINKFNPFINHLKVLEKSFIKPKIQNCREYFFGDKDFKRRAVYGYVPKNWFDLTSSQCDLLYTIKSLAHKRVYNYLNLGDILNCLNETRPVPSKIEDNQCLFEFNLEDLSSHYKHDYNIRIESLLETFYFFDRQFACKNQSLVSENDHCKLFTDFEERIDMFENEYLRIKPKIELEPSKEIRLELNVRKRNIKDHINNCIFDFLQYTVKQLIVYIDAHECLYNCGLKRIFYYDMLVKECYSITKIYKKQTEQNIKLQSINSQPSYEYNKACEVMYLKYLNILNDLITEKEKYSRRELEKDINSIRLKIYFKYFDLVEYIEKFIDNNNGENGLLHNTNRDLYEGLITEKNAFLQSAEKIRDLLLSKSRIDGTTDYITDVKDSIIRKMREIVHSGKNSIQEIMNDLILQLREFYEGKSKIAFSMYDIIRSIYAEVFKLPIDPSYNLWKLRNEYRPGNKCDLICNEQMYTVRFNRCILWAEENLKNLNSPDETCNLIITVYLCNRVRKVDAETNRISKQLNLKPVDNILSIFGDLCKRIALKLISIYKDLKTQVFEIRKNESIIESYELICDIGCINDNIKKIFTYYKFLHCNKKLQVLELNENQDILKFCHSLTSCSISEARGSFIVNAGTREQIDEVLSGNYDEKSILELKQDIIIVLCLDPIKFANMFRYFIEKYNKALSKPSENVTGGVSTIEINKSINQLTITFIDADLHTAEPIEIEIMETGNSTMNLQSGTIFLKMIMETLKEAAFLVLNTELQIEEEYRIVYVFLYSYIINICAFFDAVGDKEMSIYKARDYYILRNHAILLAHVSCGDEICKKFTDSTNMIAAKLEEDSLDSMQQIISRISGLIPLVLSMTRDIEQLRILEDPSIKSIVKKCVQCLELSTIPSKLKYFAEKCCNFLTNAKESQSGLKQVLFSSSNVKNYFQVCYELLKGFGTAKAIFCENAIRESEAKLHSKAIYILDLKKDLSCFQEGRNDKMTHDYIYDYIRTYKFFEADLEEPKRGEFLNFIKEFTWKQIFACTKAKNLVLVNVFAKLTDLDFLGPDTLCIYRGFCNMLFEFETTISKFFSYLADLNICFLHPLHHENLFRSHLYKIKKELLSIIRTKINLLNLQYNEKLYFNLIETSSYATISLKKDKKTSFYKFPTEDVDAVKFSHLLTSFYQCSYAKLGEIILPTYDRKKFKSATWALFSYDPKLHRPSLSEQVWHDFLRLKSICHAVLVKYFKFASAHCSTMHNDPSFISTFKKKMEAEENEFKKDYYGFGRSIIDKKELINNEVYFAETMNEFLMELMKDNVGTEESNNVEHSMETS